MLLMAGTLLSSLIIPWINGRSARVERRQNGRQQKAVEVLRAAGQDTRRLNALRAVFDSYERDVGAAKGESVEDRRADLQRRVYDLYGEFNGDAWWWYWEALREADVFDWLNPAEQARLRQLASRYQENLTAAVKAFEPPWQRYLSEERRATGNSAVMPAATKQLGDLQAQRDELAAEMVRVFR